MATNKHQIALAEAQLLGFYHSDKGYGLDELIGAMGLTPKEWQEMKDKYQLTYLTEEDKARIDKIVTEN